MIVEDNVVDIEFLSKLLLENNSKEYDVIQAKTAREGLTMFFSEKPDCVLLDYQLPDMNGIQFLKTLQKTFPHTELPVVMITGTGNEDIAVKAIQTGAQHYLKKGHFKQHDLFLAIEMTIKKIYMTKKIIKQQKVLQKNAYYDFLTNLPNRSLFLKKVEKSILLVQRDLKFSFAVLFIDLDRFKLVNDSYGHHVGDKLIVEASKRLMACIREKDMLARLGGDEFTVYLENIQTYATATDIANRIRQSFTEPFYIGENVVYSTASIGIALSNKNYADAGNILRDADTAMYAAKNQGKSRFILFDNQMHDKVRRRIKLESDLRYALQNRLLQLYYQPIVSFKNNIVEGFEALLRWKHHEEKYFIPPVEFIPIAEETGMILDIGNLVLDTSCKSLNKWHAAGKKVFLTVNFSPKQLWSSDCLETLDAILASNNINPKYICLEFTESSFIANTEASLIKMRKMVGKGFRLSIDDFGTGYSSLSYLNHFPVHSVKIDRSFIKNVPQRINNTNLNKAIISMAHSLGLKVVAEGIENESQARFLLEHHCDYGQGYYFSRPTCFEETLTFLNDQENKKSLKGNENEFARFN